MKLLSTIYRRSDNTPLAQGILDTHSRHIGTLSMLSKDVPSWARSTIRTTIRRGWFIAKNNLPSMADICTNNIVVSDYCSVRFEPCSEALEILLNTKPPQLPTAPRKGTGVSRPSLSSLTSDL